MLKNYRIVQQWNNWFAHFLGKMILEVEKNYLMQLLETLHNKQTLLIGVPNQQALLQSNTATNHIILGPLTGRDNNATYIESSFYELPITSASIDLVILPHTLEYSDNPRQLLNEACRIVKSEGKLILFGFNPYSLWGAKKWLLKNKNAPWSANLMSAKTIKEWLVLADFELISHNRLLFRPPLHQQKLYDKLMLLDWVGQKYNLPFGNIYVLIAKAKQVALTPIRLQWKQQISNISSITVSGQTYNRQ